MNGGFVLLAIIVGIAVISLISRVLKSQENEPAKRRASRAPQRRYENLRVNSEAEQDRFLAEIERLRNKSASAKPVPTVKPQRKPAPSPRLRFEDLPAAPVVGLSAAAKAHALRFDSPITSPPTSTATVATIATVAEIHKPAAAGGTTAAKMASMSQTVKGADATPFSRDLLSLLQSQKAMPLAVVLQEILGPPKSQRR